MTASDHNTTISSSDALDDLLSQASPRPVPPSDHEALVRTAVHAEWRTITRRRRSRRRLAMIAVAASVLVAVFVSLNSIRVPDIAGIQVATISRSFGSIYLLGERAELHETNKLTVVLSGQTIATGNDSGLGLRWSNGASLRIDADTRVVFVSPHEIYLRSGRVYFDSQPSALPSNSTQTFVEDFVIRTDHGSVAHQGTQYTTYANSTKLSVSVREGEVTIDGDHYVETVTAGRQVTFTGSSRPSVLNISRYDNDAWDWIEQLGPVAEFDGRTIHEFLLWVGHETGLRLQYETDAAEDLARNDTLRGTVATGPTNALRIWMMGIDLDWRIEDGIIYIRESGTANSSTTNPVDP